MSFFRGFFCIQNFTVVLAASLIFAQLVFTAPESGFAATLLEDSFTGTSIDTAKWDVVGSNVSQNDVLTVSNSYVAATWGTSALVSDSTFSRTDLTISAVITGGSDTLIGYGDYNFQTAGTAAYLVDITGAGTGAIYALSWSNGSLAGSNFSCGNGTNGATYTLKVVTGGFEIYKNTGSGNVLMCSLSHNGSLTNKKVFLQAAGSASTFDNLLVTDATVSDSEPSAIDDLAAVSGDEEVDLSWDKPAENGESITDYLIDYRTTSDYTWVSYSDGTSVSTTTTVTGLTNGTTYGFRVRAVNSIGTAADSNVATSTPSAPAAPDAPSGVSASAGDARATVSFTAPNANGSPITGYTVTSSPGGITATGASSPIVVTGLTNDQAYTFTVTATNGIGTSVASSASNSVTPSEQVPLNIPSLALWLDASDADTITSSGGLVSRINDKSEHNRFATASGGAMPTVVADAVNGNSILRFDGGTDYLNISSSTGYRTVFVVAKFDSASFGASDYNGIIGDFTGSSPNNGHIVNGIANTTKIGIATSNFTNAYRNGYSIAGATGHDFSPLNEYWIGSFELSANATNTTSAIGAINGGAGRYWDGDIGEVIVYGRVLTDLERTNLEGYLSDKWGIAVATPPAEPDAITDLTASTTGPSSVHLSWSVPANNGSGLTDYTVDYRVTGAGSWSNFSDGVSTSSASATVTGLSASTAYQFRVRAVNGIGTAADSNIATATTDSPTVPSAPTSVSATAGNGQAVVSFTTPASTGGSAITGYTVTSSPGGLTGTGASSPITVTGLTNGQAYTFTVTATNSVGTSVASAASDPVTPEVIAVPEQVTGLVAYGVNKQVNLFWTEPSDGGDAPITDYLIEYKLTSGSTWSTFSHSAATSTRISVTGLTNDSQYDFRVSAVNDGGAGTASSVATATPAAITTLAFVITGESNSGGIGLNSDATSGELAARSAVQITNLTSGSFLYEDLDIGTNNLRDHAGLESYYANSHGFELQLANSTEAHAFPDLPQVYLTKTGQGGSAVSQWNVGGGYWNKFLERTAAAKTQLPEDRTWVVWLSLGINDAISGTATSTWKTAMVAHLNKIKADLPGAIIILTEFQSMTAGSGYPTYNAVIRELAAEETNVFSVDTTGAGIRDGNHWSYAGLKTVASSMVTVTKNQLGLIYPGTPTSLSATPSSSQIALSWTAPVSNGGASITDYVIEYKTTSGSTWSTFSDGVSTSASATVSGLTGGTGYNFRVSAANSNGNGSYATLTATTTDGTAPVISSVASSAATTSATITWTTDELASSRVEYGLTNSYGTLTAETDTSPRVLSHSVELSDLATCTSYHYKVNSRDASNNSATSSGSTFVTSGCVGSSAVSAQVQQSVVAATGGTVSLDASLGNLSLSVPSGATAGNVTYQVLELDTDDVLSQAGTPTGVSSVDGFTFNFSALSGLNTNVTSFLNPITISLEYEDDAVDGFDESSLAIYRYSSGTWSALSDCEVDTTANTIECTTTNFSVFSLFGSPQQSSGATVARRSGGVRFGCKDPSARNYDRFVSHKASLCVYTQIPMVTASVASTVTQTKFTRSLEEGMSGGDVVELQNILISKGYLASGNATGYFGPLTKSAVVKFQKDKGITPAVGFVGSVTQLVLTLGLTPAQVQSAPITVTTSHETTSVSGLYRDVGLGMNGEDVRSLQKYLNNNGYSVAESGPGSPGNETTMFGYATQAALKKFQTDNGILPATGYLGPKTRTFLGVKSK